MGLEQLSFQHYAVRRSVLCIESVRQKFIQVGNLWL